MVVPDPNALPEITFTGNSMERKGGWALLRAFRTRLRGRCILNLVTPEPIDPEPGVRVFSDVRPGDRRLVEMLARSALFALPSEIDKSPCSVLEAMFAGLPVVATPVGGIPEMVIDGENGLLVPPGDDVAIADAIER
ncbi:MAG: glycosyltransferase family 4 protein, partial [Acidimicrobiia bacterium]|nr:glycosyltransferase family 4 protein [Acidimicrobiia bacterium]